jgi:CRP-like cAMP-binding protein
MQYVPTRQVIFGEGQVPDRIFTVRKGWAFRFKELSNRRRQIISFVIPGDMIVFDSLLIADYPLPYSVKALTPLLLCSFGIDDIRQFMSGSGPQSRAFAESASRYCARLVRRVVDLGQRSARGRIAQLMLELEGRLSRRGLATNHTFDFPLRQEHIADATGLTGAHVNRVLADMRKQALIDMAPRRLQILDLEGLQQAAEEG